jgi:hypothetical protein
MPGYKEGVWSEQISLLFAAQFFLNAVITCSALEIRLPDASDITALQFLLKGRDFFVLEGGPIILFLFIWCFLAIGVTDVSPETEPGTSVSANISTQLCLH